MSSKNRKLALKTFESYGFIDLLRDFNFRKSVFKTVAIICDCEDDEIARYFGEYLTSKKEAVMAQAMNLSNRGNFGQANFLLSNLYSKENGSSLDIIIKEKGSDIIFVNGADGSTAQYEMVRRK